MRPFAAKTPAGRLALFALVVPMLMLGACKVNVNTDDKDGNGSIANGSGAVSVSVPGFDAKVNIPGLELGGDNMDIDGMKLYPGSKLGGINVTDHDGPNNGRVDMAFTSPGTPEQVAAYYVSAAREHGFTDVQQKVADGKATVTAKKSDGDDVTITLDPSDGGSQGRIMILDGKK